MEKKVAQATRNDTIALDLFSQAAMASFQLDVYVSRLNKLGDISLKEERIQELSERLEKGQRAIGVLIAKLQEIRMRT